ncbi:MAG: NAD(+) diphosphatase [Pseudomonadota bacterium]
MRLAETVTFGGSALDRAAQLRDKTETLQGYLSEGTPVLMIWRGKPLMDGDALGWVAATHPLVAEYHAKMVFLGLDEDQPRFAVDVSYWQPEDLDGAEIGAFIDTSEQRPMDVPETARFAELRAMMTRLTPRDAELAATGKAVLDWHRSHRFCARCGAESVMAMAGWQRNCPACEGKHFPRTDPVVIMLITHGNSVLIGRSHFWPEGMYSLLAGFVEPGETVEAAVRREVFEEAGVTVGQVDYLASQPWPFPASLMIGCHGHATSTELTIDPVEIEDAFWVTRERMMEVFAGNDAKIKPARKGAIAHFLLANWLADSLD